MQRGSQCIHDWGAKSAQLSSVSFSTGELEEPRAQLIEVKT